MEEIYPGITEDMLTEIPIEIQEEWGYRDRCKDETVIMWSHDCQCVPRRQLCTVGELKDLYYGNRLRMPQLSKKLRISQKCLSKIMVEHGIRKFKPAYGSSSKMCGVIKNHDDRIQGGYVMLPTISGKTGKVKWKSEHRMIMEDHVGRKLSKNEQVHHIDYDKTNNDISNLYLCSLKEHGDIHASAHDCIKTLYQLGIVMFVDGKYCINYNVIQDELIYLEKIGSSEKYYAVES